MVRTGKFLLSGLIFLCCIIALFAATNYYSATQQNALILAPDTITDQQTDSDKVLFARAWHLSTQPTPADHQLALDLYNQVENRSSVSGDNELWRASQYNMGLIYLQQAKSARTSGDKATRSQFMPLLELAMQAFKAVIRQFPGHYDARFSLEQALSEIPKDNPTRAGWKEQRSSVFSQVSGVSKGGP